MAKIHMGPAHLVKELKLNNKLNQLFVNDLETPNTNIQVMQPAMMPALPQIEEVVKYIHTDKEVIKEVTKYVEVPISVEVVKVVETIKEVPVEVIKYVDKEVIKEVTVYTEKYVPEYITKLVVKNVNKIPYWMYGVVGLQTLIILKLLLF